MSDTQDIFIPGPSGKLAVRTKGFAAKPKNVVVFVQGANLTGQLGYDLTVPGGSDYSLMQGMVDRGLGAVTFSIRGYGKSELTGSPLDVQTNEALEDTKAVMDWLATQGYARPHLVGWSWGGRIVGRYAEDNAGAIDRLVLLDAALGGGNKIAFDLAKETEWWSNTYEYFMARLEDEFMEMKARTAVAEQARDTELKAPNGIRVENANGSQRVDGTKITTPTLMLYGSAAGQQNYMQGGVTKADFFESLATEDKALVVIPGGGDYGHIQNPRKRFQKIIADFLLEA